MNYKLIFDTKKDLNTLIAETKFYFLNRGFKLIKEDSKYLEFKRGSLLINRFTFNPLKWKSETKIRFAESGKVIADFSIDTTYQLVIQKEADKWGVFIENYQKELLT